MRPSSLRWFSESENESQGGSNNWSRQQQLCEYPSYWLGFVEYRRPSLSACSFPDVAELAQASLL